MKINASDREFLEELRRNTRNKKIFIRYSVLILVDAGYDYETISLSLAISLKSVQRYVQRYKEGGVDRLVQFNYQGRESELCEDQIEILKSELDENLYTSTEQIQAYIADRWNIQYSRSGIRDLLHRIGYVYKKAKIIPGKADG